MVRKILNIGSLKYLVEKFDYNEYDNYLETSYIMLRKYDYANNIAIDNTIIFIPISDLLDFIHILNLQDDEIKNDNIIFINDSLANTIYSQDYHVFNSDYTNLSFLREEPVNFTNTDNDDEENNKLKELKKYVLDIFEEIIKKNSSIEDINKYKNSIDEDIINNDIKENSVYQIINNIIGTYTYKENIEQYISLFGHEIYPIFTFKENNDEDDVTNNIQNYYVDFAKIRLNLLKLYHPMNFKSKSLFAIFDNYINDIHFIYVSKNLANSESFSETEINIQNNLYSEYIKIYYPNIEDLFNEKNYYIENLNITSYFGDKALSYINKNSLLKLLLNINTQNIDQFLSMNTLKQKYRLEKNINQDLLDDDILYKKIFVYEDFDFNSYTNASLSLFFYNRINDTIYEQPDLSLCGTVNFIQKYDFNLRSFLGFDSYNKISVISRFSYPSILLENKSSESSETDEEYAYCKYYNILDKSIYVKNNYSVLFDNSLNEIYEKIDYLKNIKDNLKQDISNDNYKKIIKYINTEYNLIPTYAIRTIEYELIENNEFIKNINIEYFNNSLEGDNSSIFNDYKNTYKTEYKISMLEASYQNKINIIIDNDELRTDNEFIYYSINIATDIKFENIIYTDNNPIVLNEINNNIIGISNFLFNINNIFTSYDELPQELFIKTSFADRYSGVFLMSNTIIVTKEWMKYFISENKNNLRFFNNKWNKKIISENMKLIDTSNESINVNFIDKIKCITAYKQSDIFDSNNNSDNNDNKAITNIDNNIIYKPIFFKVNDLSKLILRANVIQNKGIYLDSGYTINTYKLRIEDNYFNECARKDNCIIFEINANLLTGTYGTYDLYTENDTYVTSGSWSVY